MNKVLIPSLMSIAENISQEFVGHKHIHILFWIFCIQSWKKKVFWKQKLQTSIDKYHSLGFLTHFLLKKEL